MVTCSYILFESRDDSYTGKSRCNSRGMLQDATGESLKGIPYSGNLLREEIFANLAILLSEEILAI